jgi:hypothetical protein
MEISLNGNKHIFTKMNMEEAITSLLYNRSIHFQFQTVEKITQDMKRLASFLIICFQEEKEKIYDKKERLRVGRLVKRLESFIRFIDYKKTHNAVVSYVYDFFLSLECLGTLPGFGFGNKFGDKLMGNSERVSLRNIRTLLKE